MNGDDGGFVIVWMALMLLVLLAFCGFGIDVANWWFVGQKEQRAADAAALAGSVYLPNDFPTGRAQAIFVAAQNGYKNGVNATVTATQEPQPSRIRVTVTSTVTNFFAGLVGYNTETISRDAVADFQGPVPMGSPTSGLGQDPDEGDLQNFWLNTSGPGGTKREGDRFATKICNDSSVARCSGTTSLDYDPNSYLFRVRVGSIQAGQPLVIQVYDPAWIYTEDFCNNGNMPTDLQQNNIPNLTASPWNITNVVPSGPGNITRYGQSGAGQSINSNGTRWCTGDQNAGGASGNLQHTTYIIRQPDLTPWSDTDNPIVSQGSCQPTFFRGINQPLQLLLDPTNAAPDAVYVKNYFHRWATVCSVPAANVVLGDYIVQVKTNSSRAGLTGASGTYQTWGSPSTAETTDNSIADAGYNRYAMRAGFGTSSGVTGQRPNGTGVSISATTNLPIYANAGSDTTPTFYLARITPTAGSGRTLLLNLYDLGDVGNGSVDVHVVPPSDASTPFSSCTVSVDNGSPATFTSSNCTITGMTSAVYNGRLVTASIPIPPAYDCNFSDPLGCWVKIQMTYSGGAQPNDTTTWTATLNGDPVRLVE